MKKFKALTTPHDSLAQSSADFETVEEAVKWLLSNKRSGRVLENRNGEYFPVKAVKNGEVTRFESEDVHLDDRPKYPSVRRPKGAAR